MRIMGFDVSSSTVGWAVLDVTKQGIKYHQSGWFKPSKKGHVFANLTDLQTQILTLLQHHRPDKIAIEDLVQYMPKMSSAATIIKLAIYNRLVGLTAFEFLQAPPELYSVMAIRHGIKLNKQLPAKEDIPVLVEQRLQIKLTTQFKKTGSVRPEKFDEADAIACALFCALKQTI